MNERPTRPDADDEFDTAPHARRRLLPPLDDAHDAEPSPALDHLVLSRARESLRLDRAPERHFRGPRWAAPVAIAATVVLSFGLVTQMPRGDATLSSADEVASSGGSDATLAEAAPAEGVAPPVPGPTRASRAASASAPAAASAPPPASAPPASFAAAAAQEAGQAAARAEKSVADAPEPHAAREAEQATPAASSRAIERAAPSADAMADGSGPATLPRAEPQRWLDTIEQLQAAGDLEAARRELALFRKRYPDQPLPPSLDRLQ